MDEIDRKLIQLEMAKISLENEPSTESARRLREVEKEMEGLKRRQNELTEAWEKERKGVVVIQVGWGCGQRG